MLNIENKQKVAHFWLTIITAMCLIIVTIFSVISINDNSDHYISKRGYVVKITGSGKKTCLISLVSDEKVLDEIIDETGIYPCF